MGGPRLRERGVIRGALDLGRVDAYLARLGSPAVRHDAEGLARLQAAHLFAVPFHNLLLLENDARPFELPRLEEVVDEAIAGVGGNCDRTTPPFTALLHALGYDARLAAATVREPGDHFVCVVHTDGARFLCDVGNGHPYLRPWNLDGPTQEQSFLGWRFRFDPSAEAGPTLLRVLPDGEQRRVYVVDPAPRAYDDFAPMVRAHYTRAGFGPFLTGLRAASIHPDAVLTLRDVVYARDTRFGHFSRRIAGRDAMRALLIERFGLAPRLVDDALAVLERRHPEMLASPRWTDLGRGRVAESVDVARPARSEVPDVLVSLATVGRGPSVKRLLDTLAEEIRESGYPGRVGVLIVENYADASETESDPDPGGLAVQRVTIASLRPALEQAAAFGLLPAVVEGEAVSIGAAREAQVAALRLHLERGLHGLPHPTEHPVVVWMVDDDVAFQQLGPEGRVGRHTHLLFRAARFWAELPQHSVILGEYTGDPPVPGLDSLGGQLFDLTESVRRMHALGPDAKWSPTPTPERTFDAYYDLTEAPPPSADVVWPYAPERAGERVRDVAKRLLASLARLRDGQQLTRALTWDGLDAKPRPSLRRGGNALFLDLDALFRWPTPVLATTGGVTTRRADTIWAALARRDEPGAVVEATLPLLHGRDDQSQRPGHVSVANAGKHSAGQVRGFVLARAISEGRNVADELRARESRVVCQRRELRTKIGNLREEILRLVEWADSTLEPTIADALESLALLEQLATAGDPPPGNASELEAFLARLPDAVRAWRGAW